MIPEKTSSRATFWAGVERYIQTGKTLHLLAGRSRSSGQQLEKHGYRRLIAWKVSSLTIGFGGGSYPPLCIYGASIMTLSALIVYHPLNIFHRSAPTYATHVSMQRHAWMILPGSNLTRDPEVGMLQIKCACSAKTIWYRLHPDFGHKS